MGTARHRLTARFGAPRLAVQAGRAEAGVVAASSREGAERGFPRGLRGTVAGGWAK